MKLKELEEKVKILDAGRDYYVLNAPDGISVHILKFNKKKNLWEYYFEDERGGIHQYKAFSSEEEACDFALNDAKARIKIYSDAFAQAEREAEERKKASS